MRQFLTADPNISAIGLCTLLQPAFGGSCGFKIVQMRPTTRVAWAARLPVTPPTYDGLP